MNFKPDGTILQPEEETAKPHLKNYRLKGIRDIITPELLMHLAAAGQGDAVLIAASNFPAAQVAKMQNVPIILVPGHPVSHLITEIMKLITVIFRRYVVDNFALRALVGAVYIVDRFRRENSNS